MTKITELGFSKGVVVETVFSTFNFDGEANAAPMGITMESAECLVLRIYTSCRTYKNLQSKKCGVVNLTYDPEIFYRTAFKEANPSSRVPQDWFEKAEIVDAPKLRMAEAQIEVALSDIKQLDDERAEVLLDVKLVQTTGILPKAYCRALFATVEAIVHATRVQAFITRRKRDKREQALKLLETIKECRDIVNRVAPNSRYSEIMEDLNQRIESWRAEGESLR